MISHFRRVVRVTKLSTDPEDPTPVAWHCLVLITYDDAKQGGLGETRPCYRVSASTWQSSPQPKIRATEWDQGHKHYQTPPTDIMIPIPLWTGWDSALAVDLAALAALDSVQLEALTGLGFGSLQCKGPGASELAWRTVGTYLGEGD